MTQPTITWFQDSPDAGLPECVCSLCGQMIRLEDIPIRAFNPQTNLEARFHFDCFKSSGIQLASPEPCTGDDADPCSGEKENHDD